jgi:AcrR family transcriptional regulator
MRPRDENKEQAIREKAIEVIVREGFDGLSMGKLARAAGVSPATIYIYYKDRDDLIEKLVQAEGRRIQEAMLQDFDPSSSFEQGLRQQWRSRATFFLENPQTMHFLELVRNSPQFEKTHKADSTFVKAMRDFAHNAIERKELIPLPFEVFWSIAYAPLYQLVKFHLLPRMMGPPVSGKKFVLDEQQTELAFQLVLKALKP